MHENGLQDIAQLDGLTPLLPEHIEAKQAEVTREILRRHKHGSTEAQLALGIWNTMIGEHLLQRSMRTELVLGLCVTGQQHLTRAHLLLHDENRAVLMRAKAKKMRSALYGALAAARLAHALRELDGKVYLPTMEDDRDNNIDLVTRFDRAIACLQIKAARNDVAATLEADSRLFGTLRFHRERAGGTAAIAANLVLSHTHESQLVCPSAQAFAARIAELLNP
jgi:hypothetical protein